MAFGMNVKTCSDSPTEPDKLDRALERVAREPNGLSTHTYDAVDDAIRMLVRNAPRTRDRRMVKRAVIVVTDGFPVGDTVSAQTVIERANAADVSVYTVTLPSYSTSGNGGGTDPFTNAARRERTRGPYRRKKSLCRSERLSGTISCPRRRGDFYLRVGVLSAKSKNAATGSSTRSRCRDRTA